MNVFRHSFRHPMAWTAVHRSSQLTMRFARMFSPLRFAFIMCT